MPELSGIINYVTSGNKIIISGFKRGKDKDRTIKEMLDDNTGEASYVSQVEEVISKDEIIAAVPIYQGKYVKLAKGARYVFVIYAKLGMVAFIAKVSDYFEEDNNFFLRAVLLTEGEMVQRRGFFRLDCFLPLMFDAILEDEEEATSLVLENMHKGEIRDISGGGIRFVTNAEVPSDTKLRCVIDLGSEKIITIGKILRFEKMQDKKYNWQCHLIFAGITVMDQERIIKYIFNEQRRQLKAAR